MSHFTLVDPRGWEYDLHSVYSAYIGYFQLHNIPWYERSWGHLFTSFEEFLAFSWPVITVTDTWTGRAHIVTRLTSIGAFLKMIKTRFGETLPQAPNILQISPFETATRHLRNVSDYASYKKLYSTLPAAVLSALKIRVKAGEPKAIKELWDKRDKTFLAIDFEWSERNEKSCLEWGYAAVRCGHLDAMGHWPPAPDSNYRKGHYIISEYVDKVFNKHCPTHPWAYTFGESQVCPKAKLPQIIQAVISSLASPDSETTPNNLVLVAHGISGDLARMEDMKIKLPHNMLILDTASYERALFSAGHRPPMPDPNTSTPGNPQPRATGTTLSLENLLRSLGPAAFPNGNGVLVPGVTMHNAGNDALLCLFALQTLLEPEGTTPPLVPKRLNNRAALLPRPVSGMMMPMPMAMTGLSTSMQSGIVGGLAGDFGQMQVRSKSRSPGASPMLTPGPSTPSRVGRRLSSAPNGNGNGGDEPDGYGWPSLRR